VCAIGRRDLRKCVNTPSTHVSTPSTPFEYSEYPHVPSAAVICAKQRCADITRVLARMRAFPRTADVGDRFEASVGSSHDSAVKPCRVQTPEPPWYEKAVHALAASQAVAHDPARPCTLTDAIL
jgi:hypothetical protein